MGNFIRRALDLRLPDGRSAFLWGPRKVGKSFYVREHFPDAILIDLLKTDVFAEYASRPSLLRERFATERRMIVIDEVQKLPPLLDEVHWLMENAGARFVLTGSSARKLRRGQANLLGGRAWRRHMTPLCVYEVEDLDLERVFLSGLLPPHFLSPNPIEDLRGYVADYLKEEIAAEAAVQNIPAFSTFLQVAALSSSELLNYTNIARETGVSAKVVRSYFQILQDTFLGSCLPPWTRSTNRRMILTEKFYWFDVGVTNYLCRRRPSPGTPEFGKSFEQLLFMEISAYKAYRNPDLPLSFWRTNTGLEVDFILGDREVALEIKGTARLHDADLHGLRALREEGSLRSAYVVCLEELPRRVAGDIWVLPWREFIRRLWAGEVI